MSDELLEQLRSLLPPASYDPTGKVLTAQMTAEANVLQDALSKLESVEAAIFPETSGDFITDWERVYGLTPEDGDTYEDRVQAVLVAMGDLGGQSIPYFIAMAKRFGLTATVDVNRPALTGIATVNTPATDGDALYEWRLNVPLEAFSRPALELLLQIRRPANTEVKVGYGKAFAQRLLASTDRIFNTVHYVMPEAVNG
ncbi:putative phage tail protein [Pseudomonas sp. HLMP]|uniref:putative phage tail protein n=1 Tax=Pseudomonas sp. HLMP TaxID=3153767 RepID=UPI003966CA9C